MQHKSNTHLPELKSQLSTMLNDDDLAILKARLPSNWVELIQAKVDYSPSRIREVLRDATKYNSDIIDAAIDVAAEHSIDSGRRVLDQKKKIQALIAK